MKNMFWEMNHRKSLVFAKWGQGAVAKIGDGRGEGYDLFVPV